LDSSIVTAIAAHVRPPGTELRTYSCVFEGFPDFDESWKVRSLTSALGLEPAAFEPEPQGALWLGLQHVKQWGLPLSGAGSLIDIAMVAEAAGDGAEVVLDGQTGDEVLGFAPYLVSDRLLRGRLLAALKLARSWPFGRPTTRQEQYWILKTHGLKGAAPYRLGRLVRKVREKPDYGPRWLRPAFRRQWAELEDKWAWKATASGPRWWRHLADVLVEAPHRELRLDYLRHRAATAGVTNESPLYDFDLINYCLRLPPELAYHSAFNRPLARESVRGLVPDDVRLNNQKANFSSFCFDLLTRADAPGIERLLTAPDAEIGAYADMQWVRNLWYRDRPRPGARSMAWGTRVWTLSAMECWLRAQADDAFVDGMLGSPDIRPPALRRVALNGTRTFSVPTS
jgi:asparagine synthetase B (glutamine-hydrolysing)